MTDYIPMRSKTHYGLRNAGRRGSKIPIVNSFSIKWHKWANIDGQLLPVEGPFYNEPGKEFEGSYETHYIVTEHGNIERK